MYPYNVFNKFFKNRKNTELCIIYNLLFSMTIIIFKKTDMVMLQVHLSIFTNILTVVAKFVWI